MLELYIYGFLNRVRSSRLPEAEAHRNIEVIWLQQHLKPDFRTIAAFRRVNSKDEQARRERVDEDGEAIEKDAEEVTEANQEARREINRDGKQPSPAPNIRPPSATSPD